MSREGEVRSSELETDLSSSEDRKALKVTFLSIPNKAQDVCCVLKGKDEGRIRSRFQFPSSVRVRIPNNDDRGGLAVFTLTRCVSTRLTSSVVFVFPSIPFLRNFLAVCHLLLLN